jgi:hypothetical protein
LQTFFEFERISYIKQKGEIMSSQRNTGTLVVGTLLIAFGLLTLAGQVFRGLHFWITFWPFIVVGVGAMFFVGMFAGGKSVSGLAIPASIITTIGLILFYQNLSGHWESWSYGWTVILISVGLGIFIMGAYGGSKEQRESGLGVIRVGLILFILFGGFFEMIFSAGARFGLRQAVFPIGLILLGLYLIVRRLMPSRTETIGNDLPATENLEEEK